MNDIRSLVLANTFNPTTCLNVYLVAGNGAVPDNGGGYGQGETVSHSAGMSDQDVRVLRLLEVLEDDIPLGSRHLTVHHANRPSLGKLFLQHMQGASQWHEYDDLLPSLLDNLLYQLDPWRSVEVDVLAVVPVDNSTCNLDQLLYLDCFVNGTDGASASDLSD